MPHRPEDRDKVGICAARKKNGETCRAFAGQGTDHLGVGRCKYHGGNTPNHKKHALVQEAKQRSAQFGEAYDLEPVEALLWMVQLSAGQVRYLGQELAENNDRSTLEAQVATRLWNEERDRLARTSKAALDAGVQERAVAAAERTGIAVADLLRRIFGDPELDLTHAQRNQLPVLIRRHLPTIERSPGTLAPGNVSAEDS
jgi:hypothetical protein